jgi:hypothetical protein
LKYQEILIVEDLLQTIQVWFEADWILRAQREVLSAGLIRYFGDTGLAKLCFPSIAAVPPDAWRVNGVNNDASTLARGAGWVGVILMLGIVVVAGPRMRPISGEENPLAVFAPRSRSIPSVTIRTSLLTFDWGQLLAKLMSDK